MTFADAIDQLSTRTRTTIVVDWRALEACGLPRDRTVAIAFGDQPLGRALELLLLRWVDSPNVALTFWERDGIVRVTPSEDLSDRSEPVLTIAYDVHEIVSPAPGTLSIDPPEQPVFDDVGGGSLFGGSGPRRLLPLSPYEKGPEQMELIVRLLLNTVDPNSWRENGGSVGTIRDIGNMLVVGQRREAHEQVAQFLDLLLAARRANTRRDPPKNHGVDPFIQSQPYHY